MERERAVEKAMEKNIRHNLNILPTAYPIIEHTLELMYQVGYEAHQTGSYQTRPVIQSTLDGEHVATYPSTMEAQRRTGIRNGSISNAASGTSKTAGGYIWKYKE